MEEPKKRRFLTTEQAAEELNVSSNQIRALLKTGELRAIQVGGRGMWRIGINDLEDYIVGAYRRTEQRIASGEIVDDAEPDTDTEHAQ
jgi:excisionase family DNA binding protein